MSYMQKAVDVSIMLYYTIGWPIKLWNTFLFISFRVDIYSSHEGELYCKPHFKELFKPKVIVDDEEPGIVHSSLLNFK